MAQRSPDADEAIRPARPTRRRDPEGHRAAILAAAHEAFSALGYARATVRDIARRAGVTHGSVMRHFGTKEQLFVEAMPGVRDLPTIAPGPAETLPERIAAAWVERMEAVAGSDPATALILSASDREAAIRLYEAVVERSKTVYRKVLGESDDTEARLELMAAQLLGISFMRYVLRVGPLAEMRPPELVERLTATLRNILLAQT